MPCFRAPSRWSRLRSATIVLLIGVAAAVPAQAQRAFLSRYSNTAVNGDIVLIGNMSVHCPLPASAACTTAQNGGAGTNNGFTPMAFVDVDSDATTTNSSSATLSLPTGSTVLFAGLYWGAVSAAGARSSALFATPTSGGAYTPIAATTLDAIGSNYRGFRDVTALVAAAGNGVYTVAGLQASIANGAFGGWTLVVAYSNPVETTRNLNVFDGWLQANTANSTLDISVTGLVTPLTGAVNSRLGLVVYDGDKGNADIGGGAAALLFGATTATLNPVFDTNNPLSDIYNSTISDLGTLVGARNPPYGNTLGLDIDRFTPNTPLPNGATTAVVRVRGQDSDVNFPGVVTLATQVFVPNLQSSLTKTASDVNGGTLLPGDEILYTISGSNTGNDGAIANILTDAIPANTTYVAGTLQVVSGANAGAKSDTAGNDQAEFDSGNNRVVFRLGTGANGANGGAILPTESFSVSFRVSVNTAVADSTVISNQAVLAYQSATLGQAATATSDGDAGASGTQPTTLTVVRRADLAVTKTDNQTDCVAESIATYTLVVSNAGPAIGDGAVLKDVPGVGLTLTGVSCTGATNGAACPAPAAVTLANLVGAGIILPTLPATGTVTFQVTGTCPLN
jgi:uncharacterized repeat protein (TIGR01451 family)